MKLGNYYVDFKHIAQRSTVCKIAKEHLPIDDELLATGISICGDKDYFDKKTGRKVALTKALKNLNIPKQERTIMWNDYFKYCKK